MPIEFNPSAEYCLSRFDMSGHCKGSGGGFADVQAMQRGTHVRSIEASRRTYHFEATPGVCRGEEDVMGVVKYYRETFNGLAVGSLVGRTDHFSGSTTSTMQCLAYR